MLHPGAFSGEHDDTQHQYLSDIIDYIQSKNVEIVTVKEGFKRFYNVVDAVSYKEIANAGNFNNYGIGKVGFAIGNDGTVQSADIDTIKNMGIIPPTSNQTIYVSTTGSDANDGSELSPLKTIQKAISKIPIVNNYTYTIYVDGAYNTADYTISYGNLGTGEVIIQSKSTDSPATFRGLTFKNISTKLTVQNLNIDREIVVENCQNITFDTLVSETTRDTSTFLKATNSNCNVLNSTISNKSCAITAEKFSNIYSYKNTGTNNRAYASNYASIIVKQNNSITGTNQDTTSFGGQII